MTFTLIGTTDVDYHGDPAAVHIDASEISYLCALANSYFKQQITPAERRVELLRRAPAAAG